MQGAEVTWAAGRARITRQADLPLGALLLGRPVADAATLLPRLFNICRMAQGAAACLAMGLPVTTDPAAEVLRDHAVKLFITLRVSFDLPPLPLPRLTAAALFGPGETLPQSLMDYQTWQTADLPAAALARDIARRFAPQTATCAALPTPPDPLAEGAFENSPAGRQSGHPLLRAIEAHTGRGPLWRYLGLLADAEAALKGQLPAPALQGQTAVVQAARGAYALRITHSSGLVTSLSRRTPTDHLLAPAGALEQALSGAQPSLAPLIIALHDPCVPVTIREAQRA
jgi:hypothetical protein